MVLEKKYPQCVEEPLKPLTLELATIPRLGQTEFQSLRALVRNFEGSLRLVYNLHLFRGIRTMDEDRRLLHIAIR